MAKSIEELEQELAELKREFTEFKMFAQRRSQEDRQTIKAYGGTLDDKVDHIHDQINDRFDLAFDRIEAATNIAERNEALLKELLGLFRGNVEKTVNPEDTSEQK